MLAQETSIQEANKAILRAIIEAYNQGKVEEACSITHPDCMLDGKPFGRVGDLARSMAMYTAFPDMVWTWDGMIAEGDWVSGQYTFRGTFKQPYGEVPPNGKEVRFSGVSLYRFEEGQIVEFWEFYDKLGLYQQMGLIPAMG